MRLIALRVRGACAAALVAAALTGPGCAHAPLVGQKQFHLTLIAAPDLNSTVKGRGSLLGVRVVQVSAPSEARLISTKVSDVWEKEKDFFGTAYLSVTEYTLLPGTTQELTLPLEKGAKAIVVLGAFFKPTGECWHTEHLLSQGGNVRLPAGANCFSPPKN